MKKSNSLFYFGLIFILAQFAWLSLLGLWIYWYVSNYIIITKVGEKLYPQIVSESTNVFALVSGLVLLVFISVGMFMIFIYLTRQINITRLYDNFIGNITHELKSPLSSIQLYLETFTAYKVPEPKQKEFLNLMKQDVDRLNNLITSILDISGLEQKKIAYNFQICAADPALRTLINESRMQFFIPEGSVQIEGQPDCQCVIDQRALKIVFNNLFDNAVKYSKDPVRLKIKLEQNAKYLIIKITDQGIGLSTKDQKKVFNKFLRIYGREIPSVKGTGLGLYWVKEIIKYHGGKVTVTSEGHGHGTTFTIELPIYQASKKRYINRLLEITRRRKINSDDYHE